MGEKIRAGQCDIGRERVGMDVFFSLFATVEKDGVLCSVGHLLDDTSRECQSSLRYNRAILSLRVTVERRLGKVMEEFRRYVRFINKIGAAS